MGSLRLAPRSTMGLFDEEDPFGSSFDPNDEGDAYAGFAAYVAAQQEPQGEPPAKDSASTATLTATSAPSVAPSTPTAASPSPAATPISTTSASASSPTVAPAAVAVHPRVSEPPATAVGQPRQKRLRSKAAANGDDASQRVGSHSRARFLRRAGFTRFRPVREGGVRRALPGGPYGPRTLSRSRTWGGHGRPRSRGPPRRGCARHLAPTTRRQHTP